MKKALFILTILFACSAQAQKRKAVVQQPQLPKITIEEALANYEPNCNNRVIMGTDGDFNVGVTNTDALVEMVENYARKGIYMTCLGFGMGNLNDAMMETVSNHGNGT